MASVSALLPGSPGPPLPPLFNGDRLSQQEFHRRYEASPEDFRAELIGGIVFVTSPIRWQPHGSYCRRLSTLLGTYEDATPGVDGADNATIILDDDKEPQPDLALRILPECGGQASVDADSYLVGAPELAVEIAHSTVAIDMHQKRLDYQHAGVLEYFVLCAREQEVHWFSFQRRRKLKPDTEGIYRSRVFPGLWIDGPALLSRNGRRLQAVLNKGLASPEHAAFIEQLKTRRR